MATASKSGRGLHVFGRFSEAVLPDIVRCEIAKVAIAEDLSNCSQ